MPVGIGEGGFQTRPYDRAGRGILRGWRADSVRGYGGGRTGEGGFEICPYDRMGRPVRGEGAWVPACAGTTERGSGSWGMLLGQAEAFADYLVELLMRFAAFAFFFEAFAFVGVVAGASGVVEN